MATYKKVQLKSGTVWRVQIAVDGVRESSSHPTKRDPVAWAAERDAAGLRVTETCSLKVADIDSERMMLRVSGGKGGKDRYTLLSPALLDLLRQYWRSAHPTDWLFPNAGVDIHTIGTLMGHDKIDTTARYLHLRQQVAKANSPLDLLSGLNARH